MPVGRASALYIYGVTHSNTGRNEAELAQIKAESIGCIPLGEGAYLHVDDENATEVLVVGVAQAGDAVLLVG